MHTDVREERIFESFLRGDTLYSLTQNKPLVFSETDILLKKNIKERNFVILEGDKENKSKVECSARVNRLSTD